MPKLLRSCLGYRGTKICRYFAVFYEALSETFVSLQHFLTCALFYGAVNTSDSVVPSVSTIGE